MPWETHAGQPRPWRNDSRLRGQAAPGYPDDYRVLFPNPDSARGGQHEVMWVRVTSHHRESDLFLGILLNEPNSVGSAHRGDNVVFKVDPTLGFPVAQGAPRYDAAGWPAAAASTFFLTVRHGLREYRAGNNGHNMPAIERCISVLDPALRGIPPGVSREEQFIGHYVLGRCLAEKYATELAIAQFRAATALDPDDADAHMALLAELSLMTHKRPGTLSAEAEARWEREFLEELAVVRGRFASHDGVNRILRLIFDPAQEAQVDSTWRPHLAKLRRVGFGVFRWKQR